MLYTCVLVAFCCADLFKGVLGNSINEVYIETFLNDTATVDTKDAFKGFTNLTPFGLIPPVSGNVIILEFACFGGCILLADATDLAGAEFYEICFAYYGNLIIMWRISDGEFVELARKVVPNLLACFEMTMVWVTWNSGVITFGTGNPETTSNGLLTGTDYRPFTIYGIGVTSITHGEWKFIIKANPTGYYCRMSYTYATGYLISETTQKTRTFCAIECQKSNDCLGFNYRYEGIMNCELVEVDN